MCCYMCSPVWLSYILCYKHRNVEHSESSSVSRGGGWYDRHYTTVFIRYQSCFFLFKSSVFIVVVVEFASPLRSPTELCTAVHPINDGTVFNYFLYIEKILRYGIHVSIWSQPTEADFWVVLCCESFGSGCSQWWTFSKNIVFLDYRYVEADFLVMILFIVVGRSRPFALARMHNK